MRHGKAPMRKLLDRRFPLMVIGCLLSVAPGAYGKADVAGTRTQGRVILGNDTLEPRHDLLVAGRAEAFRLWAHDSGLAATARIYIDLRSSAQTVIVGMYGNANGRPGPLLSTGRSSRPGEDPGPRCRLRPRGSCRAGRTGSRSSARTGRCASAIVTGAMPQRQARHGEPQRAAGLVAHGQGARSAPLRDLRLHLKAAEAYSSPLPVGRTARSRPLRRNWYPRRCQARRSERRRSPPRPNIPCRRKRHATQGQVSVEQHR